MTKDEEDRFIYVSDKYIKELQQKAEDAEYFRGRVHGLEYVIDAVAEALKGADDERMDR